MLSLQEQAQQKQLELNNLKNITELTDRLKTELDILSKQVKQMHQSADTVADVMKNWDSIIRSISQASLGLLQYAESDYEVDQSQARVDDDDDDNDLDGNDHKLPLPEALVRIGVNKTRQS